MQSSPRTQFAYAASVLRTGGGSLSLVLSAALSLAGCGARSAAPPATFAAARAAAGAVTIEGTPELSTLRRATGQPTQFTVREDGTGARMIISVPTGVAAPANMEFATRVVVTGTYNAADKRFVASSVETKVPSREQQPRG